MIHQHFRKKAEKLLGEKRAELEQWAHEGKLELITQALIDAFNEGRDYESGQGLQIL